MKKLISLLLALALVFTLAACGAKESHYHTMRQYGIKNPLPCRQGILRVQVSAYP